MNRNKKTATQQQGFTIIQMVVTLAIIAVVSTFGVLGIRTARAEYRLHNSARLFASYIEKARADAIRRHAADGAESSVETFGPGTSHYAITMDFGSGLETRTFELDPGMTFTTVAEKVTFDWRGRLLEPCEITKACVFQVHSTYLNRSVPVDVSGSGDITVDEQHFPDQLIPPVEISEVVGDVYPETTPTPTPTPTVEPSPSPEIDPNASPSPTPPIDDGNGNGNGNGNGGDNGNGNGNPQPSPTPSALPTPAQTPGPSPSPSPIPPCVSSISPSTLSLSQSDPSRQSGSATFTIANGSGVRIISSSLAGNGNSLTMALSLQRIDGSGSSVITIGTKNGAGNRGVFIVQVAASPACGSTQQLTVSVSN